MTEKVNIQELKDELAQLEITVPPGLTMEELEQGLAAAVNYLRKNDFEKLLFILYRVDVNEHTWKTAVETVKNEDTGLIIARLLLARQIEKIALRKKYTRPAAEDADEKW